MIRIVKMTFEEGEVENFQELFRRNRDKIRNFEGCWHLELYKDLKENNFFTYSYWDDEEALDRYRDSDLFRKIWGETKKMFSARPEAWSVRRQ